MAHPVIRVEGLGKRYRIGERTRYRTVRETWQDWFTGSRGKADSREIWALQDVSFEVSEGEVVGVIGRNGAGKSTLLKLLARITRPSVGSAEIRGRVGSLLEVGTGFHPELTGRENIFLNGAILGMGRREMRLKLDDIVGFAEIGDFLDTPVKRYSSGMYVRLAFSVAAHLEPDILLLDEVLAVGDAGFQKKCLGKMEDASRQGRTVLFVSHNMAAVVALCSRGVLFDGGRIACDGLAAQAIEQYGRVVASHSGTPIDLREDRAGNGSVRIREFEITNCRGERHIRCDDRLRVRIRYEAARQLRQPAFLVGIYDHVNRPIFFLDSSNQPDGPVNLPATGEMVCETGPINVTPGRCVANVAIVTGRELADHVIHAGVFDINQTDFHGSGCLQDRSRALCLLSERWSIT